MTFGRGHLLALMLGRQHLSAASAGHDASHVIDDLVGLHATVMRGPYLQLRARIPSFREQDLDALLESGRAARVGCMRRTLFIESVRLLPVVVAATRSLNVRDRDRFLAFSGLTPARYERLAERVEATLTGRALTARELRNGLATGEPMGPILIVMCDEQRLVRWRGPRGWSTGPPTYRLLREALPTVRLDSCEEDAAVRELVARYIRRYGPVREHDITWWTGLSATVVRAATASLPHLVPARVEGLQGNFLVHESDVGDSPPSGGSAVDEVSLLPPLDPYLQSYHDRERCLDRRHVPWVVDRGGNTTSVILIGGRVAGIWDVIETPSPELRLFFLEPPDPSTRRRVRSLATEVAHFLGGRPTCVREVECMEPLTARELGGFQSPLAHLP